MPKGLLFLVFCCCFFRVGVEGRRRDAYFLVVFFLAGDFVVAAFLAVVFFTTFLTGAFLAVVFLAGAFSAVVFFTGAFLAVVFLAGAFFAVVFLAGAFFAVVFLATGFLACNESGLLRDYYAPVECHVAPSSLFLTDTLSRQTHHSRRRLASTLSCCSHTA